MGAVLFLCDNAGGFQLASRLRTVAGGGKI